MLGYLLLVFGLLFLCTMLTRGLKERRAEQRTELAISVVMLGMILWLVKMANSKTALVALCVSAGVIFALGSSLVRRYFGRVAIAALVVVLSLQWAFNIWGLVLESAGGTNVDGADGNLGGGLEALAERLVGSGFQSFWLGHRLTAMWAIFPVFGRIRLTQRISRDLPQSRMVGLLFVFLCMLAAFYHTMRDRLERAIRDEPSGPDRTRGCQVCIGYGGVPRVQRDGGHFSAAQFSVHRFPGPRHQIPETRGRGRTGRHGGAGTKRDLGPWRPGSECAPVAPARNRERAISDSLVRPLDRANRTSWPVAQWRSPRRPRPEPRLDRETDRPVDPSGERQG